MASTFIQQNGRRAGIIVQLPAIHQQFVMLKIGNTVRITAADDICGNIVPALPDPDCHVCCVPRCS